MEYQLFGPATPSAASTPARGKRACALPESVERSLGTSLAVSEGRSLDEWLRLQVDARVDRAVRDVRSVADAQARLLRVVEGISQELTRVTVATGIPGCAALCKSGSSASAGIGTAGSQDSSRSSAGSLASQLAQHKSELTELRKCCTQEATRVSGLAAEVQRAAAAAATAAAASPQLRGTVDLTRRIEKSETDLAELRQLRCQEVSRFNALFAEVQLLRQVSSKVASHEHLIQELQQPRKQVGDSAEDWRRWLKDHELQLQRLCARAEQQEASLLDLRRRSDESSDPLASHRSAAAEEDKATAAKLGELRLELRQEVAATLQQVAGDLRGEVRTAMQSHAAAIKALDEQLWLLDEQLWQTDKRLADRIEELSQNGRTLRSPHFNLDAEIAAPSMLKTAGDAFADAVHLSRAASKDKDGLPNGVHDGMSKVKLHSAAFVSGNDELSSTGPPLVQRRQAEAAAAAAAADKSSPLSARLAAGSPNRLLRRAEADAANAAANAGQPAAVRRHLNASLDAVAVADGTASSGSSQPLQISMLSATGLKRLHPSNGAAWCCCEVRSASGRVESQRCRTASLPLDPTWDETHVVENWHPGDVIVFTVYSEGPSGSEAQGSVTLHSEDFQKTGHRGKLPIRGCDGAFLQLRVAVLRTLPEDAKETWSRPPPELADVVSQVAGIDLGLPKAAIRNQARVEETFASRNGQADVLRRGGPSGYTSPGGSPPQSPSAESTGGRAKLTYQLGGSSGSPIGAMIAAREQLQANSLGGAEGLT
eukprot:TRINITY_DN22937_c0_g1_i1.p1 TRINITY_DN22937_c0_g1~~TRINITY_DN22937_c0_g1_i1.p1  ORF type:complete len:768 (+),score=190.76 TRINITY_DN22937_c0_g1_i1:87-2390(+)